MMLLSENAGCPQCGSLSGRRWRSYSGIELCTDCEWDYFSELNGRKLLDAKQAIQPFRPTSPRRPHTSAIAPLCANPHNGNSRPLWRGRSGDVGTKGSCADLRSNSICRSCGHIFYSRVLERCLRCRGLCEHRSDHDLTLMSRYAQRFIEAER